MSRNHLFVRANLSFDHAVFIQYFLTYNLSICITFLIQITDPATAQRPRRAIGSQCHARGEKSDIVCVGQQHRRSGYLIDTGYGCHVLHAGSTWPVLRSILPLNCVLHAGSTWPVLRSQSTTV